MIPEEDFSGIPAQHRRDYANAIYGYYEYTDRLIGHFLSLPWPRKVIMLVSDHGFQSKNKDASRAAFWKLTDTEEHAPHGVIILHGSMVIPASKVHGATIYDVFPTVLYLLGLPLPTDIRGALLRQALRPSHLKENPPLTIASYGYRTDAPLTGASSPMDEQIIENLKSIGYLQGR